MTITGGGYTIKNIERRWIIRIKVKDEEWKLIERKWRRVKEMEDREWKKTEEYETDKKFYEAIDSKEIDTGKKCVK